MHHLILSVFFQNAVEKLEALMDQLSKPPSEIDSNVRLPGSFPWIPYIVRSVELGGCSMGTFLVAEQLCPCS